LTDFLKEPSNLGYIVENVVASHLKRIKSSEIFYWRNGGEIDFVIYKNGKKISLIEVKYQAKINPENAKILNKLGGGSFSISRKVFSLPRFHISSLSFKLFKS